MIDQITDTADGHFCDIFETSYLLVWILAKEPAEFTLILQLCRKCVQKLSKRAWIAQWVEPPTEKPGAILTRVRVPGAARDFSPRINFQCRLSHGVRTAPVHTRTHQQVRAR